MSMLHCPKLSESVRVKVCKQDLVSDKNLDLFCRRERMNKYNYIEAVLSSLCP